jgi:hypothetical protein
MLESVDVYLRIIPISVYAIKPIGNAIYEKHIVDGMELFLLQLCPSHGMKTWN